MSRRWRTTRRSPCSSRARGAATPAAVTARNPADSRPGLPFGLPAPALVLRFPFAAAPVRAAASLSADFWITASDSLPKSASVQVAMIFFSTRYGSSRSPRIVTSRAPISAAAAVRSTRSFCRCKAALSGSMMLPLCASISASVVTGCPCTSTWSLEMCTTTVSRGLFSEIDSGSLMSLGFSSVCTSAEFTSRKNTRMVKMSISDTRFNPPRRLRLWWRSMRRARLDFFMTGARPQWKFPGTARPAPSGRSVRRGRCGRCPSRARPRHRACPAPAGWSRR